MRQELERTGILAVGRRSQFRGAAQAARTVAAVAAIAVAALLSGCGPTTDRSASYEGYKPEHLFERGEYELARGSPYQASFFFGEIERLYPYSDWAKRALIMQAYAHHLEEDYENSRSTARRYIESYPADVDAAYAQYLLALSYYDQIDEIGRDQAVTFDALQELRTVIEVYPESEYATSASLKFDYAFDLLAAKEMEVGRFYLRRQNYDAAINRFRVVIEDFQTTSHTPEALYRLVEAYLALGLDEEARTAGAILASNYASSEWYADGRDLLIASESGERGRFGWIGQIYRQSIRGKWL